MKGRIRQALGDVAGVACLMAMLYAGLAIAERTDGLAPEFGQKESNNARDH